MFNFFKKLFSNKIETKAESIAKIISSEEILSRSIPTVTYKFWTKSNLELEGTFKGSFNLHIDAVYSTDLEELLYQHRQDWNRIGTDSNGIEWMIPRHNIDRVGPCIISYKEISFKRKQLRFPNGSQEFTYEAI